MKHAIDPTTDSSKAQFMAVSSISGRLCHAQRLELARQSEKRIVGLTGIEETLVTRGTDLGSDVLQAKSQLAGASALRVCTEGQLITARGVRTTDGANNVNIK